MPAKPKYPTARWFRATGTCVSCGRPATGELMSYRNDVIGRFCTKHGEMHAKAANQAIDETRKIYANHGIDTFN